MDTKQLVMLSIQVALVLMVSSVALRANWRAVLDAMQDWAMLARALIAVNVVVPATAAILSTLLDVDEAIKIGLVVMAASPFAPLIPGKLMKQGLDASRVTGLYVALISLAVLIVPATVALLSAIFPADATLAASSVAKLVATSVLLPVAAGLLVGTMVPAIAPRIASVMMIAGYVLLGIGAIAILYAQGPAIIALIGSGTVVVMALTALAGIVAGHLLGGPSNRGRQGLATAAATRHPGLAAMIATSNFDDPRVVPAIFLFLLVSMLVSAIYQQWMKRTDRAANAEAAAA